MPSGSVGLVSMETRRVVTKSFKVIAILFHVSITQLPRGAPDVIATLSRYDNLLFVCRRSSSCCSDLGSCALSNFNLVGARGRKKLTSPTRGKCVSFQATGVEIIEESNFLEYV